MPTEPVTDWGNDYDLFDPGFVADPFSVWKNLRDECPVAHSDRWGGSYMPTTYADVTAVARNADDFTSFEVNVTPLVTAYDEDGNRRRSIISADAPEHMPERRLILPFFAPKAVERYRESTRDLCRQLIRGFIESGTVDAAGEYARQIPPRVIAEMLGIDPDMSDEFTFWVQCNLEFGQKDPELSEKYRQIIQEFFAAEVEKRRDNPGDDLISVLLDARLDGEPLPLHLVLANVGLMLVAGIDTTWSSIGSALWHLAGHPEDRRRLVEEPELLPVAIEEFLRAYSPVTMARLASHDTSIGECPVSKGERVILSFPAANRDPTIFENPDEVIIDREKNRHVAFGAGPHRCAGSNLARMEMQVAIGEFLLMIPEFELADPDAVTWAGGQVRGPRNLPIKFPTPTRLRNWPL